MRCELEAAPPPRPAQAPGLRAPVTPPRDRKMSPDSRLDALLLEKKEADAQAKRQNLLDELEADAQAERQNLLDKVEVEVLGVGCVIVRAEK